MAIKKVKQVEKTEGKTAKVDSTLQTVKVNGEPVVTQRKIGILKQATVNMGNYESFKVGIWQERYCEDNKFASNKLMAEMSDEIDEILESEVNAVKEK